MADEDIQEGLGRDEVAMLRVDNLHRVNLLNLLCPMIAWVRQRFVRDRSIA